MLSQQQIKENNFKLRVERFESIWSATEGSDFDKTLAMLYEYCKIRNWGTNANPVWGKIKNYYDYSYNPKSKKYKDALAYTIEYLLFRLGEKFSFSEIKSDGDFAAILQVMQEKTGIDPYEFDRKGELYPVYAKRKDKIKKISREANWDNCRLASSYYPDLVGMLYKIKIIDYIQAWRCLVEQVNNMHFEIDSFDHAYPLARKDLLNLFKSVHSMSSMGKSYLASKITLLQYLYCKYYNLPLHRIETNRYANLIHSLVNVSHLHILRPEDNIAIDGELLLYCLERELETPRNCTLMDLIQKRHLFQNWEKIEGVLRNIKFSIDWNSFFVHEVCRLDGCPSGIINYLLNNKNMNIHLKRLSYFDFDTKIGMTPLMCLFDKMKSGLMNGSNGWNQLMLLNWVKVLVNHDPDCVLVKDSKGNSIFDYMTDLIESHKKHGSNSIGDSVKKTYDEIHRIIFHAYNRRLFTFFNGRNDDESDIQCLHKDVLCYISQIAQSDISIGSKGPAFTFFNGHNDKQSAVATLPSDVVNLITKFTVKNS